MKQKTLLLSFFIISFFFGINGVLAKSTASTGVNQVYIRSLPDKDSLSPYMLSPNTTITLLEDTKVVGKGCDSNWYKMEYQSYNGYVCSSFLTNVVWENTPTYPGDDTPVDIENIYKQELAKFPDSYKAKLEALHKIYPNAIFKAQNVNVTFNNFSTYQYQGYNSGSLNGCPYGLSKGVSLLEDTNSSRDGLKSLDSWAYTALTDTFNTSFYGGQANRWYAPSLNTVKYYVDPRNFLNSSQIFMFEELSYAGDYYLEANIEKMLSGTFMANRKVTGKENTSFARTFIDAGKKHDINPYFLVSRVIQEIGGSRSAMVSGTWEKYDKAYYGYYNFYNIQAAGNSVDETIKNGLSYAKSQGWNNEYDAIVGGATFLAKDYISQGQNTNYFQKFDVYGPCYGMHQYMQNVEAPANESYKVYNAYRNANLLQSNFVFIIPVYTSMPGSIALSDTRNSNNYLRDLTINGQTISGFNYTKTDYTINVSSLIGSVEIAATKSSNKSKVSGTGTFNLTGTSQTKNIVVTAENGTAMTYKVTVTRDSNIPISISEILNTMLIDSDGTYISGINLNTKAIDFITRAKEVDKNAVVVIKSNDGKIKNEELLSTGDVVTITSGNDTKSFTVVIYGDLTGDGLINSADLLKMRQQLIGTISLKDAYKVAANVTKTDDLINSADLLKIRQHLIGSATIKQ